jgi:telomerase reverse transcriptase
MKKRWELIHEVLYYIFDSLLIPLIRTYFYVTESNKHRYQVFYFRHDVWRRVAEPALSLLKRDMFEEMKIAEANAILDSRRLGFSRIRLLPKDSKLRPIMNLRRRQMSKTGAKILRPSINSVLAPVHTVLKFEKVPKTDAGETLVAADQFYRMQTRSFLDQRCFQSATCTLD